jgi:chemotaxis signal transduction protein
MTANLQPSSVLDFQPAPTNAIDSILFAIDTVWFGIPLSRVDRIVDITNMHNDFSSLSDVQPLDLHGRLFGSTLAAPTAWAIYKDASSTLYGIPVNPVPTIVAVPLDRIRQLPIDFRTTTPLGIASHIARIRELTVFMLVD